MSEKEDPKVVAIRGGHQITAPGEVNENALFVCEEILERVKGGDVIGVAVAYIHSDRSASYQCGGHVRGYSLIGAVEKMKSWLTRDDT